MTYQIKIVLADSEPEVWRRVLVDFDITLEVLHDVIQRAMGWENLHSYRFTLNVGKKPCDEQMSLKQLAEEWTKEASRAFYYTYDFESGWLHRIEIENADIESAKETPICIGGASACPPENTGGVWGYDELLARLEDTDDPEYLDLIEKYSSFDPDKFDLAAANARLSS